MIAYNFKSGIFQQCELSDREFSFRQLVATVAQHGYEAKTNDFIQTPKKFKVTLRPVIRIPTNSNNSEAITNQNAPKLMEAPYSYCEKTDDEILNAFRSLAKTNLGAIAKNYGFRKKRNLRASLDKTRSTSESDSTSTTGVPNCIRKRKFQKTKQTEFSETHKSLQTDRIVSVSASVATIEVYKSSVGVQTENSNTSLTSTIIELERKRSMPMFSGNLRNDNIKQQSMQKTSKTVRKSSNCTPVKTTPKPTSVFSKSAETTAEAEKSPKLNSASSSRRTERENHLFSSPKRAQPEPAKCSFQKAEADLPPTKIPQRIMKPFVLSTNATKKTAKPEEQHSVQKVQTASKFIVPTKKLEKSLPRRADLLFNRTKPQSNSPRLVAELLLDSNETKHGSADLDSSKIFSTTKKEYFATENVLPKSQEGVSHSTKVIREIKNALSEQAGSPRELTEVSFSEPKFLSGRTNKNYNVKLEITKSVVAKNKNIDNKNSKNHNKRLKHLERETEKICSELSKLKDERVTQSDLNLCDSLSQKIQDLTEILTDVKSSAKILSADIYIPGERVTNDVESDETTNEKQKLKVKQKSKPKKITAIKLRKKPKSKPKKKLHVSVYGSWSSTQLCLTGLGKAKKAKKEKQNKKADKKDNEKKENIENKEKLEKKETKKKKQKKENEEKKQKKENEETQIDNEKQTEPQKEEELCTISNQNEMESYCLYCEQVKVPVVSDKLMERISTLVEGKDYDDVALTILLQSDNLYHINVAMLKSGESLGCLYATEAGINDANKERVFEKFLTFYVLDSSNSVEQKNRILSHTFEFMHN